MAYPKRAIIDAARAIAFGAIGANFTAVGAAFASPVRILSLTNLTNVDLWYSDDGITEQIIIPTGTGKVLDITTNRTNQENLLLAEGCFGYIKHDGAAPASGSCYIEIVRA